MVFLLAAAILGGWFFQPVPSRLAPRNVIVRVLIWTAALVLLIPVAMIAGVLVFQGLGDAQRNMLSGMQAWWMFVLACVVRTLYTRFAPKRRVVLGSDASVPRAATALSLALPLVLLLGIVGVTWWLLSGGLT